MATDFIRIGGEIVSSPLNRNFRNLRNDISIANVNLAFSNEDGIKNTIDDMLAIENPDNAQTCYVISSGEFYRYSNSDQEWHVIMDIGQTFRQGFLNSGAVILEDYIKLKPGTDNVLLMPSMLLYFKNQPGDQRYLKGMYHFLPRELDLGVLSLSGDAYSIKVDCYGDFTIHSGMPIDDNPDYIYIGTVIVDNEGKVAEDFIFTIPDMAYTADRGLFLFGSQAQGLHLTHSTKDNFVNRQPGYYYDEGSNFILGKVADYPTNTENRANYNLKFFEREENTKLYYISPLGLIDGLTESNGLIYNQYYKNGQLTSLPEGFFTIQQHLVTPNGHSIIVHGSVKYNSIEDAYSHINDPIGAILNFPYVEATRIVLGNIPNFSSADTSKCCRLETLGRLAQVGTIQPEYSDKIFKIYSGEEGDNTPATMKFDLSTLYNGNFNELYNLVVAPQNRTQYLFGLSQSFYDGKTPKAEENLKTNVSRVYNGKGYMIADNADVEDVRARLNRIESEIWKLHDATKTAQYEQGLRYRLHTVEVQQNINTGNIATNTAEIAKRAYNTIEINGHNLKQNFDLTTSDIEEGTNLYYTTTRVQNVAEVKAAKQHYETVASDTVRKNPHNLYADDLKDNGINYHVVSTAQINKINNLYDNTKSIIDDLENRTIDYIVVDKYDGDITSTKHNITNVGNVKRLRFYDRGVKLNKNNDILEIDCTGHFDENKFLFKEHYATQSDSSVDSALYATEANTISGASDAEPMSYYGTDIDGVVKFHKLNVVTTAEVNDNVNLDNVIFVPTDGSVGLEHLNTELKTMVQGNYHKVYQGGELKSSSINEFKFGDNLTVKVDGNVATISASGAGGTGTSNFASLNDVNVVYTGNAGKTLVINEQGTGITVSTAKPMTAYMLTETYGVGGSGKVQHAINADSATSANTASNALKVNGKSVDDSVTNTSVLWTGSKIQTAINTAVSACYNTYYDTGTPGSISGSKAGDIYIMVE